MAFNTFVDQNVLLEEVGKETVRQLQTYQTVASRQRDSGKELDNLKTYSYKKA